MSKVYKKEEQGNSRGQSTFDYMFMVAIGLLFVLIAFVFITEDSGTPREVAMEHAENSSIKSQAVISKSQLENAGVWNDNFTVSLAGDYKINVYNGGELVYIINYENATYKENVADWNIVNGWSLGEIYEKCLNNDLNACKFVITLNQGGWQEK